VPSTWDPPPRAYVRDRAAANRLLDDVGGHLVSGGIVDFPFEPGLVPPVIAALELGSTPRGREMLDRHRGDLTADWAVT
jgi:hypothetical protein